MAKNLRKPKIGVKNPATAALLLSFGCGVGVCILLLALAAFSADAYRAAIVRSAAYGLYGGGSGGGCVRCRAGPADCRKGCCCAGWAAGRYAVCLLAATLLANGRLDWQGSNAMLPLALLLGGLLGGALTALRAGR